MFSFVDQITSLDGGSIAGRFAVPDQFAGASEWLIIEALGQLAAWVAIRDSDFQRRPVAATVGRIDFVGPRRPRGVLRLAATIERTDHRAVLYRGDVESEEAGPIATLRRCIGPLLPMESFDDPAAARQRFRQLQGGEPLRLWTSDAAEPCAWTSEPELLSDGGATAEFRVESGAPFFEDHFPRMAVVPATLLIESLCRVGAAAAARRLGRSSISFCGARQVKVRKFTEPGQLLRIVVAPFDESAKHPELRVSAAAGEEMIASVRVICDDGPAAGETGKAPE